MNRRFLCLIFLFALGVQSNCDAKDSDFRAKLKKYASSKGACVGYALCLVALCAWGLKASGIFSQKPNLKNSVNSENSGNKDLPANDAAKKSPTSEVKNESSDRHEKVFDPKKVPVKSALKGKDKKSRRSGLKVSFPLDNIAVREYDPSEPVVSP